MVRRVPLVLALLLAACQERSVGPAASDKAPAFAFSSIDEHRGPPSPYPFGPDHYRIGAPFTGEGVTPVGLDCSYSGETIRDCRGFLASDVDGARLDVTLQRPQTGGGRRSDGESDSTYRTSLSPTWATTARPGSFSSSRIFARPSVLPPR